MDIPRQSFARGRAGSRQREFLEDDLYAEWTQSRRHMINGARHGTIFKMVDLYLEDGQVLLIEECLFPALDTTTYEPFSVASLWEVQIMD